MIHSFQLDDTNPKAKALLEFLRTLDFVKKPEVETELSDEHLQIVNERRESYLSGESEAFTWEEVKTKSKASRSNKNM
jgi:hypothetical protein